MLFRIFLYYLNVLIIICLASYSYFVYAKQDRKIGDILFFKKNSSYCFKKLWESPFDYTFGKHSNINFNCFCQNSEIFLVNYYGVIIKIDCNNGRILWSVNSSYVVKSKLYNSPYLSLSNVLVVDNKIFIASEHTEVYAVCTNTGSLIWKTQLIDEVLFSPPVKIGGIVLIYSDSGVLRGLNEDDGSIKWTLVFDVPLFTLNNKSIAVIYSLGIVLFGDDFGVIHAISINNGKLLWKKKVAELHSNCNRVVSRFNGIKIFTTNIDNLVCVQNYGSTNVAILDMCSHSINWLYEVGSINHVIFHGNVLCLIDQNNQLIAADLFTGKILWKQILLLNKKLTRPELYNNHIILGDNRGYLYLINIDNGDLVYKKKIIPFGILHVPIIIDNKLLIQSVNGTIYSFCIFM